MTKMTATMACVIFDLDGTLIDSAPDIHAAVNRTLAGNALAPLTDTQVRGFIGNGVPVLIARVMEACALPADPVRHAALVAEFLHHYEAASADLTTVYPGVPQALARLSGAGHALGICTNKPAGPARTILTAFGLDHHFGTVIGGDSLALRKPDAAPLHAAVAALGGGRAVFVGDSEVDAETAMAARIPFALFTEGYRKTAVADLPHAAAFDSFSDLPAIIDRFGRG